MSSPAATSASPSPQPTRTATGGTTTLTDADSGRTISLAIGERLRVQLTTGTWDPPTSSSAAVVVRSSSSGGYPTGAPVDALFSALGSGSAAVTAYSDAACFHSQPACMMPGRQWKVRVVVS